MAVMKRLAVPFVLATALALAACGGSTGTSPVGLSVVETCDKLKSILNDEPTTTGTQAEQDNLEITQLQAVEPLAAPVLLADIQAMIKAYQLPKQPPGAPLADVFAKGTAIDAVVRSMSGKCGWG